MASEAPLLELQGVQKHFPVRGGLFARGSGGVVRAVDGISFALQAGETLSIVGESGCGKTTTAKLVLNLEVPTAGEVRFEGASLATMDAAARKAYRAAVQAVLQDPWSSLNPRMRTGDLIAEPIVVNQALTAAAARERVSDLLTQVGLRPEQAALYPHQFSGGQRQRIAIARALSIEPRLIVLDEPVSALDVSIRAQILNLLRDLQDRLGLGYLLIAHHLATVRHMSHHVAVMYLGQIVELAPARELFSHPLHPYTQALYAASLSTHPDRQTSAVVLRGEIPASLAPPSGCRFHPRCPYATPECAVEVPTLQEVAPRHWVQNCRCVQRALAA